MARKTSKKKASEAESPGMRVLLMAEVSKTGKVGKPKAYTVVGQGMVPAKPKPKKKRKKRSGDYWT